MLPSAPISSPLNSRRLLLQTSLHITRPITNPAARQATAVRDNNFAGMDNGVVVILAALVCVVAWALIINSVLRCVIRAVNRVRARNEHCPDDRKKVISALPGLVYSTGPGMPRQDSGAECVICLAEFKLGEHVRVLPECNHVFHICCIDGWLESRPSCPTCRRQLFGTCEPVCQCTEGRPAPAPPAL